MHRRLFVVTLAVWAGLSMVGPGARAEPVYPIGLRIGLEPQGDLTLSKRFQGFEDADRKVVVTILDLPVNAYEEIERSAFAKEQRGLTALKRESFPFAGGIGFLIGGQVLVDGVTLHKWFLLATAAGGPASNLAVLINVEVPEAARAVYTDAVVRKVLASVTFRATPLQEQLGLLPFKMNDMSGFRVLQALPAGGVILIDGPSDDLNKRPYMIVSVGSGAPNDADGRGKYSRELLSSAPLRDVTVTGAEPMRLSGGQGYEVRAQAKSLDGSPVTMVQWMRFGGSGFLRIVGVSGKDDWDALFTRFRAVRDGIEPR